MVIFDQWPKLHLEFDGEPEILILKVIYYIIVCTHKPAKMQIDPF